MTNHNVDRALRELARGQHALVSRAQARQLGLGRDALARRIRAGEWDLITPRVLRLAGANVTFDQRCMAAVLDAGPSAALSRHAAAYHWSLPGFPPGPIDVSRARLRSNRHSTLATIHEPRYLPGHHLTFVDGIPVTTVARTVFDLAGCVHPQRAERALDNALSRKLVALGAMRSVTIELLERGRTGSALMRLLLAERGAGYIPPASGLEARFLALFIQAGIEPPDKQVDLGGDEWIGRVDFVDRRWRIVYEVDSDMHHSSKLDRESDARRDVALRAAGYEVVRISEHDLRDRPEVVVASVKESRARAAAQPPSSGRQSVA